ncbi:recombination regulator RecX [Aquibacillus halophilus]|uniref:Regulatory protein RecX n=1 Tax=Aquibacillus halophilus TaxID=930132 RepID=A0A6A8DG47_9BACI|nr:recombination regulator RecX [Aquibacillus halophilus]
MAVISRITTQKKNKHRYNIFLKNGQSEDYGFSVDEDILIQFHLRKGLELDKETTEQLLKKDSIHKTYSLTINFLSYRMRSTKEIREYLIKKEVEQEQIEVVIKRLLSEGLLNDKEFAEALVRTRVQTTSKGPMLVKKELIDKGILMTVADEALSFYTYEDQFEKATKWLEKKIRSSGKKSFRQQVQSIQQTLMQKGFTQDIIKDVLANIEDEKDDSEEWDAIVYQGEKLVRKYEKKFEGSELKQKVKATLYRKGFNFELMDRFIDEYLQ